MPVKPWNRPNGGRCDWNGCDRASVGKSKFCATHRSEARRLHREKIKAAYELARMRREENEALAIAAEDAARLAGERDPRPAELHVVIRPATQSFAHYLRRSDGESWTKAEGGGLERVFPVAAAGVAYAAKLKEWGISASAWGEVPL